MQKSKKKIEPLPDEFKTLKEASDFWDTHDISDYRDKTKEATFKARLKKEPKYVALEDSIAKRVSTLAKKKHVSRRRPSTCGLKKSLLLRDRERASPRL